MYLHASFVVKVICTSKCRRFTRGPGSSNFLAKKLNHSPSQHNLNPNQLNFSCRKHGIDVIFSNVVLNGRKWWQINDKRFSFLSSSNSTSFMMYCINVQWTMRGTGSSDIYMWGEPGPLIYICEGNRALWYMCVL